MRVRNEEDIIEDSLDHMAEVCSRGIVVWDDLSTDRTADICRSHPSVIQVMSRGRRIYHDQGERRKQCAMSTSSEWILCMDADERLVDMPVLWDDVVDTSAFFFRFFDFYITEDDVDAHWSERQWIGPEYRDITVLWRRKVWLGQIPVREPLLKVEPVYAGDVKHYGKARTVARWEAKCDLYTTPGYPLAFREKWAARRGQAIHTVSDFGNPLIPWDERNLAPIPMPT